MEVVFMSIAFIDRTLSERDRTESPIFFGAAQLLKAMGEANVRTKNINFITRAENELILAFGLV